MWEFLGVSYRVTPDAGVAPALPAKDIAPINASIFSARNLMVASL